MSEIHIKMKGLDVDISGTDEEVSKIVRKIFSEEKERIIYVPYYPNNVWYGTTYNPTVTFGSSGVVYGTSGGQTTVYNP